MKLTKQQIKNMKIIKRVYLDKIDDKVDVHKRGNFTPCGVLPDGRLVYNLIDENGYIMFNEGMFYQIRSMKYHMLIMIRII